MARCLSFALLAVCLAGPVANSEVRAIVDAASFAPALAPGGLVSIFGVNFGAEPEGARALPLPAEIGGIRVSVNGAALPLLYVSGTQINAQLPFGVRGAATLEVNTRNGASQISITISPLAPAVFNVPTSEGLVPAIVHADGTLVASSAPARPGETLSIYMTGLGEVSGQIEAGQAAPASPPLSVATPFQVMFGDGAVAPSFAGLAPGFAGLYQVNVQVPALAAGTHMVRVMAGQTATRAAALPIADGTSARHYEYVLPDGSMYVYDIDNGFALVKHVLLPQTRFIRGVAASPLTHTLYIAYGGDGGVHGNGSMLAYDLLTDQVMWTVDYPAGIDSMAITPDGRTIYMPTGEQTNGLLWNVIDASNGRITGTIVGGAGPHNTVVGLDGRRVYLAPRWGRFLHVADTATNQVIRAVGPMIDTVRPFTINGKQTLAFTTATAFLGFQVSDLNTGQVLYTVPVAGFSIPAGFPISTPSHGISLSPDEKEIWLLDAANSMVHVFDVSGLPASAPRQVADLRFSVPMTGLEAPCWFDCQREGWVQHTRDGRYVVVGDSGDIFDARTRQVVVHLETLRNTRKHLEIDWSNGTPVSTTTRHGLGYVTR